MHKSCGASVGRTGQLAFNSAQRILSNQTASTRCSTAITACRNGSSQPITDAAFPVWHTHVPLLSAFLCQARATPRHLSQQQRGRSFATKASQQQAQETELQTGTSSQTGTTTNTAPAPKQSPLHLNIQDFCQRVALTEDEIRVKNTVVEGIRACTFKAFPDAKANRVQVEVFGSFANGMSTWHSDVDLVVTGMFEPDRSTGGYDVRDRGRVTARLRKIADQLRKFKKLDISRLAIIGRARIPIIKLRTRSNVSVDISISDNTGVQAARYMLHQSRLYPSMRALTLVIKAYLKSQRLNDVATGGLSSYSLCNMVVAHLQEELKIGSDINDLGETLYSFFLRYGEEFNYETDAVSVRSGGIVPKRTLPFAMDSARFAASTQAMYDGAVSWSERLSVDCPLSGRDVSNGTYRIDVVRRSFYRAARQLEALAKGRSINDTTINYLSALFDVQRVLKRIHVDEDPYFKIIGGNERDTTTGGGARAARGGPRFDMPPEVDGFGEEEELYDMGAEGAEGEGEEEELGSDVLEMEPVRGAKGKNGRRR